MISVITAKVCNFAVTMLRKKCITKMDMNCNGFAVRVTHKQKFKSHQRVMSSDSFPMFLVPNLEKKFRKEVKIPSKFGKCPIFSLFSHQPM